MFNHDIYFMIFIPGGDNGNSKNNDKVNDDKNDRSSMKMKQTTYSEEQEQEKEKEAKKRKDKFRSKKKKKKKNLYRKENGKRIEKPRDMLSQKPPPCASERHENASGSPFTAAAKVVLRRPLDRKARKKGKEKERKGRMERKVHGRSVSARVSSRWLSISCMK